MFMHIEHTLNECTSWSAQFLSPYHLTISSQAGGGQPSALSKIQWCMPFGEYKVSQVHQVRHAAIVRVSCTCNYPNLRYHTQCQA